MQSAISRVPCCDTPHSHANSSHAAGHAVQFYRSSDYLCRCIVQFLVEGLQKGSAAVAIIIKAEHEARILAGLEAAGYSIPALMANEQLTLMDTGDALTRFCRDGLPQEECLRSTVVPILEHLHQRFGGVTLYGEAVNVLTAVGNGASAVLLEDMWCKILRDHTNVNVLCGYNMACFHAAEMARYFYEICQQHQRVVPAEDFTAIDDVDAQRRAIAVLQQKALMLETELKIRRDMEQQLMRKQQALEEAKKVAEAANVAKSNFLAMVSHELRTPLVAIVGYGEILARPDTDPEERVVAAEIVSSSGKHLCNLISDILDLSKIEASRLEVVRRPTPILDMVRQVTALFKVTASQKGIKLISKIDGSVPPVITTDDLRLRQVLVNLLSNAIKFTDDGSVEVALSLRSGSVEPSSGDDQNSHSARSCPESYVACDGKGPLILEARITDSGVGIDASAADRIFQPFQQAGASISRQYGGTGVGLAISKRLAQLMGGDLLLAPIQPARGATFVLTVRADPIMGGDAVATPASLNALMPTVAANSAPTGSRNASGDQSIMMFYSSSALDTLQPRETLSPPRSSSEMLSSLAADDADSMSPATPHTPPSVCSSSTSCSHIATSSSVMSFNQSPSVSHKSADSCSFATPSRMITSAVSDVPKQALVPLRILLVEDNSVNLRLFQRYLLTLGYAGGCVQSAMDGESAIELARHHTFDVILLDIQMPGIDGYATCREIRKLRSQDSGPIIIAISATATSSHKDDCIAAGMNDFLAKPFTLDALSNRLQYWAGHLYKPN